MTWSAEGLIYDGKAEMGSIGTVPQNTTVDAVRMEEWPEEEAAEKSRPVGGLMTRTARMEQTADTKVDRPCGPKTTTVDAVGVEEWPEKEAADMTRPVEEEAAERGRPVEGPMVPVVTTTVDAVGMEEWQEEEAEEMNRPVKEEAAEMGRPV